jgi:hypothetical protein
MKPAAAILLTLCVVACREWETPSFEEGPPPALANVTLGDLRVYLNGEARMVFTESVEIAGRVVSSDREGNFYNTFFIDDGTGAAEIMAGMPDLDAAYHPGQKIIVRARGLAVGWRDGAMQIGLPPEPGSRFATGYFYHPVVIAPYVTAERDVAPVEPLDVEIDGLTAALCGRLVRITGLRADPLPGGTVWAQTRPAPLTGYTKFRSAPADSITVVTSGYAAWAPAPVPTGEVTLTGILLHGRGGSTKDHFLIKPRHEKDIAR